MSQGFTGSKSKITDADGNAIDSATSNPAGTERGLIVRNAGIVHVDDNGSSITVDGTVDTELTTADLDTGAGNDVRAVVGLVLAESGGGLLVGSAHPLPVSVGTLALPSGAATSANQATEISSLASIDGKITAVNTGAVVVSSSALPSGASTSAKQDTAQTSLSSIDGKITAVNTGAVVVSSSALPSGASTAALQTNGNNSLSSIDAKLPVLVGGKIPVDASGITVTIDSEITTADLDTGAGTDTRAVVGLAIAESGGALLVGSAHPLPISAASLPLPSGAATVAKQPALGTAGTASSDVITVQGITSMTPLKVDGSAVTQPVSGTVTANAGTNLNTSALALETGGNLATIASAVRAEDSVSADGDKGITAFAVRKATPVNTSSNDGDYEALQVSAGRLWTSAVIDTALPAGTNVIGHVIADSGSTTAVTGNVTVVQGTGTNLHAVIDSGTVTTITNVVHVDDNGSTLSVDDGGGSLTVDGSVTVTQATGTNLHAVIDSGTISTITNVVHVDDNSGSITVDGTVGISGTVTVDSELTTADLDTGAGTDTRAVIGLIIAESGGGQLVGSAHPLPISDNGGSLTVDGTVAATQSGTWNVGTVTTITNVVHVDDNASTLSIDDGAGSITVDGTVAATQSGNWAVRAQDGSGNALTSHAPGSSRGLDVTIIDGSGNQITSFGGGTQYTEADTDASITGTAVMWEDTSDTLRAVSAAKPLPVNIVAGGSGDGSILDGVSSGIKATVLDLTDSNPLTVAIVDSAGDQITSFGGGTQYTEGDTDATITGTAVLWEDGSDTLRAVSSAKPLPVDIKNSSIPVTDNGGSLTVDGTVAATQSGTWNVGTVTTITNVVHVDDNSSTISIDDGAGSITVDGTVAATQSGTWNVRNQDGAGTALTSHNAGAAQGLDVSIIDGSGNQITSFGGGSQYTEGDTDATITGNAILWEDAADTLTTVSSGTPLPVDVKNASIAVTASYIPITTYSIGAGFSFGGSTTQVYGTDGQVGFAVEIEGTWTGTVQFQVGVQTGTMVTIPVWDYSAQTWITTITANGIYGGEIPVIADNVSLVYVKSSGTLAGNFRRGTLAPQPGVKASIITALPSGTNVIGHVIADSGSTTAVTGNVTVVQGTGSNLHTVVDSGTISTITNVVHVDDNTGSLTVDNNGTFVTQVDGAALTSLQLLDDIVYTDDTSTHATGTSKGALFMAAAAPTDTSVNANDIGAVAMTTDRKLHVSVQDSLPAGTAAIGKLAANSGVTIGAVEIAAAQTLATVSTVTSLTQMNGQAIAMGTGSRSAGTQRVTVATDDVVPVSKSGTWDITNAGVFVVQENGSALTALQLIDDIVYTDDTSTHATGTSKGALFMAAATPTDTAVNANDIGAVAMTTDRKLHVSIQDAAGNARGANVDANNNVGVVLAAETTKVVGTVRVASGGIASGSLASGSIASGAIASGAIAAGAIATGATSVAANEDDASNALDTGLKVLFVQKATPADTAADGDYMMPQMSGGRVWVDASGKSLTVSTHAVTVASGGIASGSLASGSIASGAIASGAIAAGAIATGATSIAAAEDDASANLDTGVKVFAVRKATPANTSGSDGDYEFLQMSAGRLWASATIDAALPAGTNAIGKLSANSGVTIGGVEAAAVVAGGYTPAKLISANSTNGTVVKASAAKLGYIGASNINAAAVYVKVYNSTSVTVGTTVPVHVFLVPGNTAGSGTNFPLPSEGCNLSTGFCLAITSGVTDADTGVVNLNEVVVNYGYI